MKIGDIVLGIAFVSAVIIFIIPMPTGVLDILLTISISAALLILFGALFAQEPLDMSLFPALLVLTTLYRVSLNVSSTRLIIGSGNAGKIIEVFSSFVTSGNLVVGIILFIIIVLVQFIVITKGAERVAEVSARFTLDAMPGKQMAIDADLNSGLIDETQAKERRQKIQDEASFYGSMDGATKFVKGDAIIGILITFVNIIGGIIVGTMQGKGIGEAAELYTKLTIGDGLVSQIPAFLISVATAIIVTKGSQRGDMSVNLGGQLFRLSKVLYMAGGVLIFLGIFTPLPFFVLATFGAILMYIGSSIDRKEKIEEIESEITEEDEDVEEIRKPENVMELLQVDQIELEFGYGIIPLADIKQGGDLLDRVVMIRRQIATELGAVVPIVRLRDNIQLGPNEYIVKIKGTDVAKGTIMHGHYLAINQGFVDSEISGIETVEPAFNLPALWITEDQREEAEAKGYMVVDAPSLMATHLTEVIKNHLGELLTRQDIQLLVNKVKESAPALIEELVPKLMNLGEIQKVLANLLNEGISIRDLITVFETLADYATITKDPDMLTEYVRQGLSRPISRKYFEDGVNKVVTIDANLEQLIFKNIQSTEHGTYVAIDQNIVQKMLESVGRETAKFLAYGKNPIILASPVVRTHFKKMTEAYYKNLVVLSYSEVEPSIEIQSIGMVSIDEN